MKIFGFVVLAGMSLAVVAAAESGTEQLNRQTGRLAGELVIADLSKRQLLSDAELEQSLAHQMFAAPLQHIRIGASQPLLAEEFAKLQRTAFQRAAETVLRDLRLEESVVKILCVPPSSWVETQMKTRYLPIFRNSRALAVQRQRREISALVYPTGKELDSMSDAALLKILEKRFLAQQNIPLWEENLPYFREQRIRPALAEARKQQARQWALAQSVPLPESEWNPARLTELAADLVRKQLAAEYGKTPQCYGLLDSTAARIAQRSANIPQERLLECIRRSRCNFVVPEKAVTLLKQSDALAFARREYSAVILLRALQLLALPEHVSVQSNAPAVQSELSRHFDLYCRPSLLAARQAAAKAQFAENHPALSAGTWRAPLSAVELFQQNGKWELPAGKQSWTQCREETVALASAAVRQSLNRQRGELNAQTAAVKSQYEQILEEFRKRKHERNGTWFSRWLGLERVTLDAVCRHYEEQTLKMTGTPELYPSVQAEIELRSRAILQRLQQEELLENPPPKTDETFRDVDLNISVSTADSNIVLGYRTMKFSFPPEHPVLERQAMEQLLAAVIHTMEMERKTSEHVRFSVSVRVASGRIYYETVARLRQALQSTVGGNVSDRLQNR